jgi:hypothetical protein
MKRAALLLVSSLLAPWGVLLYVLLALATHNDLWLWIAVLSQAIASILYLTDEDEDDA